MKHSQDHNKSLKNKHGTQPLFKKVSKALRGIYNLLSGISVQ